MATVKLNYKEIICPECGEICKLKLNDFKITLYECINDHIRDNISLEEFNETQHTRKSKINCTNCNNNNIDNVTNENIQFFKCLTCNKNICTICKKSHNEKHNLIESELQNYICNIHNKQFDSYCNICKKNLCSICEKEHKNENDIIYFKNMISNININNKRKKKYNLKFENFYKDIKEIIEILNKVMNNIQIYSQIYNDIMNNFDANNVNYQKLYNINEILCYNKKLINEINKITDEININNKICNIINL